MRRLFWTHLGKRSMLPILALSLACGLAACSASPSTADTPTDTPLPTATATATLAPTPTFAPTATASSGLPGACQTSQLALALISSDGAAGHIRYLFKFTNVSTSACTYNGYPTVTGFGSTVSVQDVTQAYTWATLNVLALTVAPNSASYFAIQADTATVNGNTCVQATPTIAPPGNSAGFPSPTSMTTCDGNLYVAPLQSSESVF